MSRLPERDTSARARASGGRFKWRPSNAAIAIIFILIFTIGPYLAFTKHVPFTSYGYEVNATFANSAQHRATTRRCGSPASKSAK